MFRTPHRRRRLRLHVQEPENNIVRGAYIALAGALAGAQTMALPTYDEAYTIPSPKAQLIALRTMQICAEESGAADTADPLAGSYYVEALTNEMEAKIVEELAAVERMGGIVEAVKTGAIQAEVARQAYLFEQKMVSGEIPKVGRQLPRRRAGRRGRSGRGAVRLRSPGVRGPARQAGPGPARRATVSPCRRRWAAWPTRRAARPTSCRRSWRP